MPPGVRERSFRSRCGRARGFEPADSGSLVAPRCRTSSAAVSLQFTFCSASSTWRAPHRGGMARGGPSEGPAGSAGKPHSP
eukprot:123346-Chlamydomonas_euryale.AAC.3